MIFETTRVPLLLLGEDLCVSLFFASVLLSAVRNSFSALISSTHTTWRVQCLLLNMEDQGSGFVCLETWGQPGRQELSRVRVMNRPGRTAVPGWEYGGRQVSSVGSQLRTELVLFHDLMPRPVTP